MANNVFSLTPVDAVIERRKERSLFDKKPAGAAPSAPRPLSEISGASSVPLNVVEAFSEAVTSSGQVADPAQAAHITENFSAQLGKSLQSGKDMRGAMAELLGDDADSVLDRALKIGQERAPEGGEVKADGDTSWSERDGNFFTDMYSGAAGSIGAGAKAFGADDAAAYFNDIAERNAPPVQSYKDVDNFGEAVRYVTGGIAQSIPEMAAVAAAAVATVMSGGGTLVAAGSVLGASTLFNAGRAADRQEQETGDIDYVRAWGAGVAMGSLDAILPGAVGKGIGKAFSRRTAGAAVEVAAKRGIGAAALKGAAIEAPTEVMQQLIEIGQAKPDLLRQIVNPTEDELEKSDQLLTELIDSALIGGVAGGAFSGAGQAAQNLAGKREPEEDQMPPNAGLLPAPDGGPDTPPAGMGNMPADVDPVARPPQGPLSRAAEAGGPVQEPMNPGVVAGSKVRVTTPDGVDIEAEFVEETPEGVMLTSEGSPMMVSRAQLESGEIAVQMRDPIQKQREEIQQKRAQIQADAVNYIIPPIDEDISTPTERSEMISGALDRALAEAGNPTITPRERIILHDRLDQEGGSVENAMWRMLEKEIDEEWDTDGQQEQEQDFDAQPDGQEPSEAGGADNAGPGTGNIEQPDSQPESEIQGRPADEDAGMVGEPVESEPVTAPRTFTKSDGKPFADQKAAGRFMRSNGLGQDAYEIVGRDGGFVVAPKPKQIAQDEAPALPTPDAMPDADVTDVTSDAPVTDVTPATAPTVDNIREKAAVLRGVPKDSPPDVAGISLKWDSKEGGFIFARKHADKVRAAMGMDAESPSALIDPVSASVADDAGDAAPAPAADVGTQIDDALDSAMNDAFGETEAETSTVEDDPVTNEAPNVDAQADDAGESPDTFRSMVDVASYIESKAAGYMLQISQDNAPAILRDADLNEVGRYSDIPKKADVDEQIANLRTAAPDVDAAAADADPNPTEAQAKAGNYKHGHTNIQGLDVTIENARGSERKGKDAGGKEWSVTMPAHYGYIKRTKGADGEHVDVYVGEDAESDSVTIIDQKDLATEGFDEHKVVLGAANNRAARILYRKGFSDGKGSQRIGGATTMTMAEFKEWLVSGDLTKPAAPAESKNKAKLDEAETDAPKDQGAEIDDALEDALNDAFDDVPASGAKTPESQKQPDAAKDARTAAQAAKDARENIGKGADAAMDGLMNLFGGRNTLNSGFTFSKETYALAKPLFKEAMSKFATAGSDIKQMAAALVQGLKSKGMTREQISDMMPYLKQYIADEQGDTVTDEASTPSAEPSTDTYAPVRAAVRSHMTEGGAYGDVRSLRKQAAEALGRPVTKAEHKDIEEAAEEAIVGLARDIAATDATDAQKYDQLVQLYERQPLLAEKTSTSVENQAYSTPAPLAFIASKLAGITSETRVTEPSAGTGMLLIGADPALVRANEKNPDRVDALRRNLPGALVTQGDATAQTYAPYDVLITNPPFGTVKVKGETQTWPMSKIQTKEIDHAIAWRALEAMPEDGSAVLILGGVNPRKYEGEARSKGYMSNGKRQFFASLYEQFNVVDHFTAAGALYRRQGAAWPVDVIVIRGRGKSSLPLPMAQAPAMISTWADMKGKLDVADSLGTTEQQPGVGRPDPAEDAGDGRNDADLLRGPADQEAGEANRVDGPSGTSRSGQSADGGSGNAAGTGGTSDGAGRDPVSDGADNSSPARPGSGDVSGGRTTDGLPDGAARQALRRENTEVESDLQVRYTPRSNALFTVGTLVPVNMRDAITTALDKIEVKHGPVDQYVANSLGYSLNELLGSEGKPGYFSSEQVDALAMAIDNVDRGKGFIIGDQTGVGKGRFVAAMLRFAERKGRVPVFVTKAPGLYGDMVRDMRDIGEKDAHKSVLMTNSNLRGSKAIPLSARASDSLEAKPKRGLDSAIAGMAKNGTLPKGTRFVFTTYSQMQTVAGKEPARRDALRGIAQNAMFIFDESHEAGGMAETRGKKKGAAPSRADFVRELVSAANGTVFSSATYAKNPDVMSLYSSTDLSVAVPDLSKLGFAISKGGVPLQQVTAGALTEAGQYARRERSWDGVSMDLNPIEVDKAQAERVIEVISGIFDADLVFLSDARKSATETMKKQGYANMPGGRAVDIESADDSGFSSVLHNVVSQMLLSLKVKQVADRAIASFKAGEKPIIAVVNTNGELLETVIKDEGVAVGDSVDVPFGLILHRYVDRLRRVTVKDKDDKTFRIDLTDDQIGPTAVREMRKLHEKIDATDMKAMSAAPLDQLKDALRSAGMNVGEITGRGRIIEGGKLKARDNSESAKKREMLAFNSGDLDALLINQAGSTGYSLHAVKGADGNDGKPRRMLVLQPDPNIDTFMQMLGRIHRTGQTSLPAYDILVSDLAIEKRVAAILMRKMASLSANTTASKESAISFDSVTDFLNEVGDKVVTDFLNDNYDIASRLDLDPTAENIANKMTGRLALMAPDETQRVYDEVEQLYRDEIERLDAIGENPLVAQVVDWQAQVTSTSVVAKGGGTGSPLDADTVVESLSVKRIGKPYSLEKVEELVEKNAGDLDAAIAKASEMEPKAIAAMEKRLGDLVTALESAQETKDVAPKRALKALGEVNKQKEAIRSFKSQMDDLRSLLRSFSVGANYSLSMGSESLEAKVIGIDYSKVDKNPLAKSKYRIRFAVADATREVSLGLSKIGSGTDQIAVTVSSEPIVQAAFMDGQTVTREDRQVVTGNLINAFAMFSRGQVTIFTMEDGTRRSGVALPKGFDAGRYIEGQPVTFANTDQIIAFLQSVGYAQVIEINSDKKSPRLEISTSGNGYVMKAKKSAKEFFSGDSIKRITGEWGGRSTGSLQVYVDEGEARAALDYYAGELGTAFKTETNKESARIATGQELPTDQAGDTPKAAKRTGPAAPAPTSAKEATRRLIAVARDVNREIRKTLGDRVKLRLAAKAFYFGNGYDNLDGYFLNGTVGVALDAADAIGVARHEVIHALRDPKVFGGTHGAFTQAEWKTLVRAARGAKQARGRIDKEYADLSESAKIEEVVAEIYRNWAAGRDAGLTLEAKGALGTLKAALDAIINALRGNGLQTAADVFERVRSGEAGGRGPDGPGGGGLKAKKRGGDTMPSVDDTNPSRGRKKLVGNILTQAMAGKDDGRVSSLSLVPGRALIAELGKRIPAAQTYLGLKQKMDTLRNDKHAATDEVAQQWRRLINGDKPWRKGDKTANVAMMDLMHDASIANLDPSAPYMTKMEPRDPDIVLLYKSNTVTHKAAKARIAEDIRRRAGYDRLRNRYKALPDAFQEMFRTVRDEYTKMADDFEKAIVEQAGKALELSARRADRQYQKELDRVADEGLTGQARADVLAEADKALKNAKARSMLSKQARLAQLRSKFESNRLEAPYFPLARFGDLFVTARDADGKVVSFSKFESAEKQRAEAAALRKDGFDVQVGVMDAQTGRDMVDPGFVADIEGLLEGINADAQIMDEIWQRWLATLPDMSIRKSRIHRKGTPGYSGDAFRAFGKQMFHGAHQLARLKYSLDMNEALEVAQDEARAAEDPVRAGLIVREMQKRHDYVMNPEGSAWAQALTSAAFVYYLGVTPAAAIVNITQTTVVGIPILAASYGKGGIKKASFELMRAMGDFTMGRGEAERSKRLTDDEREAMREAYSRGVVDKSQAHDLAGVGETGVEYSATRTYVMGKISFLFHHAERLNREVTFLAAYRMARSKGMSHSDAIANGGELTWKTHFDYQNTARPRLMQNDVMRVLMVFKNFQINMLWRLFRDLHQSVEGKTPEEKAEAKRQLIGITAQMLLHAGVKGTWGYALIMSLIGLFFEGGRGDAEEAMEDALLNFMPKDAAAMILNGAPGHLTGINLTSRIGMPELWFRSSNRELEGADEYNYWVQQMLGAVPGIGENVWRGVSMARDDRVWRGVETMSPKFIRDIMKTGRYWNEGAETYRGDPIIDKFKTPELLSQAVGFSPARLSERYDINNRMKNREKRIMNERSDILGDVRKAQRQGGGFPKSLMDRIAGFNQQYPFYPITGQTMKSSIQSGIRSSQRNVQGVQINPKLDNFIRSTTRDPLYE